MAGLYGCRKSCSPWHSIPGQSSPCSPWQVATPTTISGPLYRAMRRRIPETRSTEINLLFVFGHSQNPGAWSPGHLELISVAPNIFSIITAVLILPYKKCVSSEARSTTREIKVTFTGHSRTVWGHYGNCFFFVTNRARGSETFGESCGALLYGKTKHSNPGGV